MGGQQWISWLVCLAHDVVFGQTKEGKTHILLVSISGQPAGFNEGPFTKCSKVAQRCSSPHYPRDVEKILTRKPCNKYLSGRFSRRNIARGADCHRG